jgi:hypothetical protein
MLHRIGIDHDVETPVSALLVPDRATLQFDQVTTSSGSSWKTCDRETSGLLI